MVEPNEQSSDIEDYSNLDGSSEVNNANNLDLIYEYTESILKNFNEEVKTINTKLGTVIAFNGILIRTAMDLPDQFTQIEGMPCYSCQCIKIAIFGCLILSTWISISGLSSRPSYAIARPGELLDNWYEDDKCKIFILKGLKHEVERLNQKVAEKSSRSNSSMIFLAVAVSLYALEALIPSFVSGL
jgi:hypothetical protein